MFSAKISIPPAFFLIFFLFLLLNQSVFSRALPHDMFEQTMMKLKDHTIAINEKGSEFIDLGLALKNCSRYIKKSDPKVLNAIQILLNRDIPGDNQLFFLREPNYAAYVLMYLCQKSYFVANDAITIAIAINEGFLMNLAENSLKKKILEDAEHLYNYYVSVSQKKGNLWSLRKSNFLAKLYWADRVIYSFGLVQALSVKDSNSSKNTLKKMNKEIYKNYVLSVSDLIDYRNIARKNYLDAYGLTEQVARIEDFVWQNFRYHYKKIENYKNLPLDEKQIFKTGQNLYFDGISKKPYFDINSASFELKLYKKHGFFAGFCSMQTTIVNAFLKSLGVAANTFFYQYREEGSSSMHEMKSHTFAAYYHPAFNRWFAYQKPIHYLKANAYAHMFYFRPVFHPLQVANSWSNEDIDFDKLTYLLILGIPNEDMKKIYLYGIADGGVYDQDDWKKNRILLSDSITKDALFDYDGDGVTDISEKRLGTDFRNWDTDDDLKSDFWEVDHNMNPKKKYTFDQWNNLRIVTDGFLDDIKNEKKSVFISDPKGDSKDNEAVDISGMYANIDENYLNIAVEYYRTNHKSLAHELWLKSGTSEIWIGLLPPAPSTNNKVKIMAKKNGKYIIVKSNSKAFSVIEPIVFTERRDLEVKIPIELLQKIDPQFNKKDSVSIVYSVMSGRNKKPFRNADVTKGLTVTP